MLYRTPADGAPEEEVKPTGRRSVGYSRRSKMRKARSQGWLEGFIRSGSMILKVRASATLRPPAMAGSRASVASPRARSRGGRATQVVQERLQLDLLVDLSEVVDALLQALGHRHPSAPCRPLPTPPHPSAGCHAAGRLFAARRTTERCPGPGRPVRL